MGPTPSNCTNSLPKRGKIPWRGTVGKTKDKIFLAKVLLAPVSCRQFIQEAVLGNKTGIKDAVTKVKRLRSVFTLTYPEAELSWEAGCRRWRRGWPRTARTGCFRSSFRNCSKTGNWSDCGERSVRQICGCCRSARNGNESGAGSSCGSNEAPSPRRWQHWARL